MPGHIALGELAKIRTGKLDANASSPDGEFPFFTCASEPLKIASFSYDCECVLVAGNGDLNVKYYSGKFDAYQRTYIVESINPEKLSTRYLYHFMESYLSTLREQSIGGIIKYIKIGNLTDAKIPLLPLPDQRRIAAILDKADALRAKRREAIAKLDQLLQSVFLEMFGDPVMNPKGWPLISFADVGQWKSGATPSKSEPTYWDGTFPWVSPKDMKVSLITDAQDHVSDLAFESTNLKRIEPGHLLIVVRGMILAHSFPTAVNAVPIAINQDMKAIAPIKDLNIVYLQAVVDSLKGRILSVVSTAGHGTCRLDTRDASEVMVPVPPLEVQSAYKAIASKYTELRVDALEQLKKLDSMFGAIQQKAFDGAL